MTSLDRLPSVPSPSTLADAAAEADQLIVPDATLVRSIEALAEPGCTIRTPEAAVGADPTDRIDRLGRVLEAVDGPVMPVCRAIDRCVLSWRHHGDPGALAASDLERAVAATLDGMDGPEATLADASALEGTVATIHPRAFDPLQRRVLPESATTVPPDDRPAASWRHGETVSDLVAEAASVLDAGSDATLVAAGPIRAHAAAVASHPARTVQDSPSTGWSAFLELLEAAATPGAVRIGDVRRVLNALGVGIGRVDDRQPLDLLGGEAVVWLTAVISDGTGLTVGALREQFAFRSGIDLDGAIDPVEALGLAGAEPTRAAVDDLASFLELARPDTLPEGIVPAESAWSTGGEPVVFLDGGEWTRSTPPGLGDGWRVRERHRLAHLLASGGDRIVLSTEREPSLAAWFATSEPVAVSPPESVGRPVAFNPEKRPRSGHNRLTKTTLNRLLASPRDALFADVLPRPDRRALTRGSAVHDYADLLLAAPAAREGIGRDQIHTWIAAQVAPFVPANREPIAQSRLEAAMAVVEAYLEDVQPEPDAVDAYDSPWWMDNDLADAFDVALDRTVTEQYFIDETLRVSGVIDLVRSPTHLVDFKTGAPPVLEALISRGRIPLPDRRADVQLPVYLAALRRRHPDVPLMMTFVYCHGSLLHSLAGIPDLHALTRSIPYDPRTTNEALADRDTVETLGAEMPAEHPRAMVCSTVPMATLAGELGRLDEGAALEAVTATIAEAAARSGLSGPTATAGARSLVRAADRWRRRRLFSDDLDRFEDELAAWHERRAAFDRDGYPLGDPIESRLEYPDLHADLAPVQGGDP